jgi:phage-related protein
MATRKLTVEIVGDASSLERALTQSTRAADNFGTKLRRASLLAGAALGGGLLLAAKAGFSEIAEGQNVAAQTAAALESTGGAANVTAKQIADLATAQSNLTGIDDELIQSGENLLLTFKNVRNEVGQGNAIFDRATKSALDLSVAGFGSVETTAKQLGKALNDPVRGMTALGRAGVTFSQQQRDAIKAMVETGDTLGAQRLILKEVESQVGGSAKAYGETLPGQLNKAKNAFQEMAASVTVILLPALTSLAGATAKVAKFFTEHETTAKVLAGTLGTLAGILLAVGVSTKVYAAGQALATAATGLWTAAQWLLNAALTANPIGVVVVALAALVGGLILAYKHSETFRKIVDAAFSAVKAAAQAVLNFFRDNWKIIATLISGPFLPIVALATDAFGIRSKLIAAAGAILDFFKGNWKTIAVLISGPFAPLVALATDAFGIRSALVNAFGAILDAVRGKMGALIGFVSGVPGKIVGALGNLGSLLYNAGVQIIQGLINGLTAKLGELYGLVSGIAGKIAGLKGPIEDDRRLLVPAGQAIIEGLIGGIQDRLPDLERVVSGIAPDLSVPTVPVETSVDLNAVRSTEEERMSVITAVQLTAQATQLTNLKTAYLTQETATQEFHTRLLAIFKKFEVPMGKAALRVGMALADGLSQSFEAVDNAAQALAQAVVDRLKRIRIVIAVGITGSDKPGPPEGRQHGGPVRARTPYIVGEAGPELFVPNQSGRIHTAGTTTTAGGMTVQLIFNGPTVGTSRDFEDTVRRALYDIGRRNPGTGLSLA